MKLPDGRELMFSMPARIEPVFQIFQKRRKLWDRKTKESDDRARAKRVAWRQLLRWVQAQCAMIDCGMAKAQEVFFPYVQAPNGQTLFEYFEGNGFKQLPAPEVQ